VGHYVEEVQRLAAAGLSKSATLLLDSRVVEFEDGVY